MDETTNPAAAARHRLVEALSAQQSQIDMLRQSNAALRHAVGFIAQAAGIFDHPVIASLGIKRTADVNNPAQPIPGEGSEAPAVTTEQARKPDATADVESPGGVDGANTGVPPQGTADVTTPGGVIAAPEPMATQDPTKMVSGTDSVPTPAAAQIPIDIVAPKPPEPTETMFGLPGSDKSGWTASANGEHRLLSSLRLARLRKQAGIEDAGVDDLALGQSIHDSAATDQDIAVETATLAAIINKNSPTSTAGVAPVARGLVPQRAQAVARAVPSLAVQGEDRGIYATAASDTEITDDELGFAE